MYKGRGADKQIKLDEMSKILNQILEGNPTAVINLEDCSLKFKTNDAQGNTDDIKMTYVRVKKVIGDIGLLIDEVYYMFI